MNFQTLKPFIIVAIVMLLVLSVIHIIKQKSIINTLKQHNEDLIKQVQKVSQHSYDEPDMNPLEAQKMFAEIMQNLNINEEPEVEPETVQIEEVPVSEKLNTIDETTEQEHEQEEDSDEDEEDLADNSEPLVVPQME